MNDSELEELARRSEMPVGTVKAVVDALVDATRDGRVSADILKTSQATSARIPIANHADPALVDDLIARARKHRLGLDFLLEGYLGSVAAEFGAHAFTVEAARTLLRSQNRKKDDAS